MKETQQLIKKDYNVSGGYKEGQILYDSVLKKMILFNGTDWVNLDGTALA